mmetsp:Transcript_32598/g.74975  ORF Transcript_32598/g.74975 Transcript_32598/m.74975 type:complete len:274 (+) Transcript_32598:102-923(+)
MEILSNEEHQDIITWLPHGKAFIIYKKKKFAAEVLPKYFKQSKFTSFTRKLNRWGFSRVTRGPETGAYYHKYFQKNEPRLCMQMSCQNVRIQNEQQLALENQAAMMAGAAGMNPFGMPAMLWGAPMLPGLNSTSMAAMSSTLMQQQLQQLQAEQLQKQQEMVRRAMTTTQQATGAAAGSIETKPASASDAGSPGPTNNASAVSNSDTDALYSHMLAQSKASSMSAQPLLAAIQNSLQRPETGDKPPDKGSGSGSGPDPVDQNKQQTSLGGVAA